MFTIKHNNTVFLLRICKYVGRNREYYGTIPLTQKCEARMEKMHDAGGCKGVMTMNSNEYRIVVSGDICINSLYWLTEPKNSQGLNWQTHVNMRSVLLPGEVLLLAKLVGQATGLKVLSPILENMECLSTDEFLFSIGELDRFPVAGKGKREKVYRIKRFLGFSGPETGEIKLLPVTNDTADADMVILDDENNGFNSSEKVWPKALKSPEKNPLILYKMNNPNQSNLLWRKIEKHHMDKTVVIINSDDLRAKGVNISKGLSWERTAQDFVWQINNSPNLAFLANCRHLIVLFGLEGAIYYRNDGVVESRLYFLPYQFEGGSFSDNQGQMSGYTSCFVAGIARSVVNGQLANEELPVAISEGIREGIVATQKYFRAGFGAQINAEAFPDPRIFMEEDTDTIRKEHVQDVVIRISDSGAEEAYWYILKEKSSANLAEIAYSIVKNGVEQALQFIPIAQFGKLQTVDRTEIESYRSIKNLMCEYIAKTNVSRPLSIAVFGTPGSGKSFGVTEIAGSIAPKLIQRLNFNLSQFRTPLDLITAFHKVRDLTLEGRIPLVFFDEFDSAFEGKLGWLKYFLAPMQDGVFREGDSLHSIGKAIFVFAGGTSSTIQAFCGEDIDEEQEAKQFLQEFKAAKGPDFLSRLRGYVNILGPNPTNQFTDHLFIIRRAMLLRALLEEKVPHLIQEGEAKIDNGVLRAMLKIPRFKHESRSMEAILDMSLLSEAKKWEQSCLPSKEQLKLHVDEEAFLRHLMHDTFYSEKLESLSMSIHQTYCLLNERNPYINQRMIKKWEDLEEEFKHFAREQAKHIPDALIKINYDVVSVKDVPEPIEFTPEELDILVISEHSYWYQQKKSNGWKRGEVFDSQKKTDPDLVKWDLLPHHQKHNAYEIIKSWPEILAKANFTIERLKFLSE